VQLQTQVQAVAEVAEVFVVLMVKVMTQQVEMVAQE
jgi:hypothetical protein